QLRVQRSVRSGTALLPQRPLQLRRQGRSDHLLHHRAAPRLSRQHRRGVEDRVRQDDADRAAGLRNRAAGRQPRSRAGATGAARAPGGPPGRSRARVGFTEDEFYDVVVLMTEAELTRALDRCEPPAAGFHHADHLRVAWVYLQEAPTVDEALARMAATL